MSTRSPYDVWGAIASAISIAALFGQLAWMNLPHKKLKELDELLDSTDEQLKAAQEEGLLTNSYFIHQTEESLATLRGHANSFRDPVYMATTLSQQCFGLVTGLSLRISVTCGEVKGVRARITTTTTEARKRLQREQERASRPQIALRDVGSDAQSSDARLEVSGSFAVLDEAQLDTDHGRRSDNIMTRDVQQEDGCEHQEDTSSSYDGDTIRGEVELESDSVDKPTTPTTIAVDTA